MIFFCSCFPQNLIVTETNRNPEQKQAAANKIDKDWQPVNNNDIHVYHSIRLLQGIKVLPSERDYWSTNPFLGVKQVQDITPRIRFMKISQYFHFNDSSKAKPQGHFGHDKLFHIRPLINKLTEPFCAPYNPNRENAIDEGLVKFKGPLAFKSRFLKLSKIGRQL